MSMEEANHCCMGYFILAAQKRGLGELEIREILNFFYDAFDEHTVDEAIEAYKNFNLF